MTQPTDREAFDAWFLALRSDEIDESMEWTAWQARAALSRPAGPLADAVAKAKDLVLIATDRRIDWDTTDPFKDEPGAVAALREWEQSMRDAEAAIDAVAAFARPTP